MDQRKKDYEREFQEFIDKVQKDFKDKILKEAKESIIQHKKKLEEAEQQKQALAEAERSNFIHCSLRFLNDIVTTERIEKEQKDRTGTAAPLKDAALTRSTLARGTGTTQPTTTTTTAPTDSKGGLSRSNISRDST